MYSSENEPGSKLLDEPNNAIYVFKSVPGDAVYSVLSHGKQYTDT